MESLKRKSLSGTFLTGTDAVVKKWFCVMVTLRRLIEVYLLEKQTNKLTCR